MRLYAQVNRRVNGGMPGAESLPEGACSLVRLAQGPGRLENMSVFRATTAMRRRLFKSDDRGAAFHFRMFPAVS